MVFFLGNSPQSRQGVGRSPREFAHQSRTLPAPGSGLDENDTDPRGKGLPDRRKMYECRETGQIHGYKYTRKKCAETVKPGLAAQSRFECATMT